MAGADCFWFFYPPAANFEKGDKMKKCLKSFVNTIYHMVDGVKVSGIHNRISGNVDDAKLTEAERKAGVDILSLVK